MNYTKLYNRYIEYFKTTTAMERLTRRNKSDKRLSKDVLYTESHHILPRSLGGNDLIENLVKILPEEHLFIHKLRYKAFNNREDMLAVRFVLNGLNNKNQGSFSELRLHLTKHILKGYAFIRQESYEFRLIHGWQTKDGVSRISEARKGTFPMKDIITGEIMGSFTKQHPNYISGQWVHHSTGKVPVYDNISGENLYIDSEMYQNNKDRYIRRGSDNSGKNNGKYIDISDERIVEIHSEASLLLGYIVSKPILIEYALNMYNLKIPTSFSSYRFKDKSLFELTEEKTNLKYKHIKGGLYKEQKEKLKEIYDKN